MRVLESSGRKKRFSGRIIGTRKKVKKMRSRRYEGKKKRRKEKN